MARVLSCVSFLAIFMRSADASAMLRGQSGDAQMVSAQIVEQTLMAELALVGRDEHLSVLQEQLRPMFAALPKNVDGRLDAPVVRYALHRYFVQTRGWFVQGLQPDGAPRDSISPVKIMKDRVPSFVQGLLERRVEGRGLNLGELAAFAATIEDLVHAEGMQKLMDVFSALGLPSDSVLNESDLEHLMETYLASYIIGSNMSGVDLSRVSALHLAIVEVYPAWPDVQLWAKDVTNTVLLDRELVANPFRSRSAASLDEAALLMHEMGRRFGTFQDQECRTMKNSLVDMEYRGTGRVRLSEFYKDTLEGNWQFAESVEYLRAIGALDESNPSMPSVLIANYVGSQSNCLASSSFYSVCCLDECEGLLGQIELAVGEPVAELLQLLDLVRQMHSDTVDAPRNLSAALLSRLEEIASHHGGRVPLHGRLFAQWMHHAFPRECPFPHHGNTTNPMTPDEWMSTKGSPMATEEVMQKHVHAAKNVTERTLVDDLDALPWAAIEELVAVHEPAIGSRREGSFASFVSKLMLLVTACTVLAPTASKLHHFFMPAVSKQLPRYVV